MKESFEENFRSGSESTPEQEFEPSQSEISSQQEEAQDKMSQIKQKIDMANLDTEWLEGVSAELSGDFKESKNEFEQGMVVFTLGIIDYLRELDETGIDPNSEVVLFFPGRSGLGIEQPVRTAIRDVFGSCPLSVRIPTESELESGKMLGGKEISERQEGTIEEWSREKISTPELDKLLSGGFRQALIIDTWRAGGRTLKQTLFAIRPYPFEGVTFFNPIPKSDKPGNRVYREKILDREVVNIEIPMDNSRLLDDFCKNLLWLSAGVNKVPSYRSDREKIFESSREFKDLEKKIEKVDEEIDRAEDEEKVDALRPKVSKLMAEYEHRRAEFEKTGQKPPPLKFIKRSYLGSQDREKMRQYLAGLGHIAAELSKNGQ